MYTDVSMMIESFGAAEMAGIGSMDTGIVPSAEAVILASEVGATYPEWITMIEQGAALNCVSRIEFAIEIASKEIDSYLAGKYRLPLTQEVIDASILPKICADLARYFLMDDQVTPEVIERTRAGREFLRLLSTGKAIIAGSEASSGVVSIYPEATGTKSCFNIEGY